MKELAAALARLEASSRALLDLSLRRGLPDEEIAEVTHSGPEEVARERAATLERLADDLGLDGREQRDELFATLQDLPPGLWND
jgi:DNA-directed RNA polymerase specialized sigma24 family protein